MRIIYARNVNDAYSEGMQELAENGLLQESRAGSVLVLPTPVMTVYSKPMERVLFDRKRDANPFFHLVESLWMLAGRDDAEPLNRYVRDFGSRFCEKDGAIHGAYGHRWRRSFGVDQLDAVVEKLQNNSNDRQAVIQMWDCLNEDDLTGEWKDRPCNTHIYLRVREVNYTVGQEVISRPIPPFKVLDLTVCCRSNDIVFGAYGANAVHFSMLQEYLAGRIGVEVGTMYQFSNNWHGYMDVLGMVSNRDLRDCENLYMTGVNPAKIGNVWKTWDADLLRFWRWHDGLDTKDHSTVAREFTYDNVWFKWVAEEMVRAHYWHRAKDYGRSALHVNNIAAADWQIAARQWIQRRRAKIEENTK